MIVLSETGNVLMDAKSIFISEFFDKNDKNIVAGHRIMAACETSPRPTTLRTFYGEDSLGKAQDVLKELHDTLK